jgi:hypothetical protein
LVELRWAPEDADDVRQVRNFGTSSPRRSARSRVVGGHEHEAIIGAHNGSNRGNTVPFDVTGHSVTR